MLQSAMFSAPMMKMCGAPMMMKRCSSPVMMNMMCGAPVMMDGKK